MAPNNENHPRTDGAGRPFYDRETEELKSMLKKRAKIQAQLEGIEDNIYDKESEYLDETPNGNIIIGWDNYTKGTNGVLGGRRRGGVNDGMRIFSRSSVSYKANVDTPEGSALSTPLATAAPTPSATSFAKGDKDASNGATPTSSTSGNRAASGLKRAQKSGDVGSDGERDSKKARTGSIAVSRK